MLQLKNNSPFSPTINIFADENGIDTLYVTVKATFNVNKEITLADEQIPPQEEDEYWGDPNESSPKYLSEMHLTPIFKCKFGIKEVKFALPQRSPKPLIVPCTKVHPSFTAVKVLATAQSESL